MQRECRRSLVLALAAGLTLAGCASDNYGQRPTVGEAGKGFGLGAATGAVAGALIGSLSGDAGKGALLGAVGGAIAGGLVGSYMEAQRQDFEKELADEIVRGDIRVEVLPDDRLLVGMTSATAFDIDSDQIKPGFNSTMDKIAAVVNQYGKTRLVVSGYTDDTGSNDHNLGLSERRAGAVESYLLTSQVIPERLTSVGYGEDGPVAPNDTEVGRTLNRRVEITIIPIVAGDTNAG